MWSFTELLLLGSHGPQNLCFFLTAPCACAPLILNMNQTVTALSMARGRMQQLMRQVRCAVNPYVTLLFVCSSWDH